MKLKIIFNVRRPRPLGPRALLRIGLGLCLLGGPAAAESRRSLAVEAAGFSPAALVVASGARVRIDVTNRSATAIEFESHDLNRERVVQPGQTVTVYVSELSPGSYEFFDDFHPQRRGALVVK